MNLNSETLQKTLNFETLDGVVFRGYKFVGILDAETASIFATDIRAWHAQMYPYLTGVANDYRSYSYGKFIKADGSSSVSVILGLPWIKESSIEESSSIAYRVLVRNATYTQIQSLRNMMMANGLTDFEISQV